MDELIELVIDVLKIADEYLMDRLKEICENVLGDQGNTIGLVGLVCSYPYFSAHQPWHTTCNKYYLTTN